MKQFSVRNENEIWSFVDGNEDVMIATAVGNITATIIAAALNEYIENHGE